jgi:hypothetical protein
MDQSNKKFLPVVQGMKLSETQRLDHGRKGVRMKVIPYASAIGSLKYAMLCA